MLSVIARSASTAVTLQSNSQRRSTHNQRRLSGLIQTVAAFKFRSRNNQKEAAVHPGVLVWLLSRIRYIGLNVLPASGTDRVYG
jgi:hypothetical protein